jgi:hypothetical protein
LPGLLLPSRAHDWKVLLTSRCCAVLPPAAVGMSFLLLVPTMAHAPGVAVRNLTAVSGVFWHYFSSQFVLPHHKISRIKHIMLHAPMASAAVIAHAHHCGTEEMGSDGSVAHATPISDSVAVAVETFHCDPHVSKAIRTPGSAELVTYTIVGPPYATHETSVAHLYGQKSPVTIAPSLPFGHGWSRYACHHTCCRRQR